ncbi:uncharacterized protein LOC111107958 isoform X2 [Crassostrea virginica]
MLTYCKGKCLLLKPLSGEDSQGKINLSILTLWVIIDHWTKSFGFCMDFMVAQKDMIILERSCIKSMLIMAVTIKIQFHFY